MTPKKTTTAPAPAPAEADDTQAAKAEAPARAPAMDPVTARIEAERHQRETDALRPGSARMSEANFLHNRWAVTVARGVTREMLLDPRFWTHIGAKLRPWDHVEAYSDDGTFYAEYLVLACDRLWAKLVETKWVALSTQDVSLTQAAMMAQLDFTIQHEGPYLLWTVKRKVDAQRIAEKHQTEELAHTWLRAHLRTVGAPAPTTA